MIEQYRFEPLTLLEQYKYERELAKQVGDFPRWHYLNEIIKDLEGESV